MSKLLYYLIILGTGGAGNLAFPAIRATQPHRLPGFTTAVHLESTAVSENPAFLTTLSLPEHLSYLQLSADKQNGGFRNYPQSNDSFQWTLNTESYYRLNPSIMLYGAMGYTGAAGKVMEGTAFINPSAPFQIIESDASNKGDKKLETYRLQGGIGWEASSRLSLGASIRYTAANYAKHKDLRHKNTLMDMNVSVGANWKINPILTAGLSYRYHRNNEAVEFATYGNKDIQYYSLISYGNFYGLKEAFGESGYTASRTPLFTQSHGGGLQWHLQPSSRMAWFSELYYHSLDGRFGKGTSTSITFNTHEGTNLGYNTRLVYKGDRYTHVIDAAISTQTLQNYENAYKESTDESNVTQIIYYGSNEVMDRKEWNGQLDYTLYIGMKDRTPIWTTGVRTLFYTRRTATSVYPYYRKQYLHQMQAVAHASRNLFAHKGMYTFGLLLGYGTGGGTLKEDGLYATPGSNQQAPFSREDLLQQEFEYYTAPRSLAGLNLRYEHPWSPKLGLYGELSYQYTRAYQLKVLSPHRHDIGIRIGCKF